MEEFLFYDYIYTEDELQPLKDICFDQNNQNWERIEGDCIFGNRDAIHGNFDIPVVSKLFDSYIEFLPEIPREQFKKGIEIAQGKIICDIKLSRYNKGDHCKWHSDDWAYYTHTYNLNERIKRQFTCITYLNDNFEGGETEFKSGLIVPKENKTLILPSHWEFAHRGKEVISGTKYLYINHIWF